MSRHVVTVFVVLFTVGSRELEGGDRRKIAQAYSNGEKEILAISRISESSLSVRLEGMWCRWGSCDNSSMVVKITRKRVDAKSLT